MGLPAQWGGVGLEQEEQDEPSEGVVISEGEEELHKCTACLFVRGYMVCVRSGRLTCVRNTDVYCTCECCIYWEAS